MVGGQVYSKKHDYIMQYNAKSGCTLVRQLFLELHRKELPIGPSCLWHCISSDFPMCKNPSEKIKYIVVRNPYTRMVSIFLNKYVNPNDSHNRLKHKFSLGKCSFLCFLKKLLKFKNNKKLNTIDIHIQEQCYNYTSDKTLIVKLENFDKEILDVYSKILEKDILKRIPLIIANIQFRNTTTYSNTKCYDVSDYDFSVDKDFPHARYFYNEETQKLVYEIYKSDFMAFGYCEELPY